MLADRQTDPHTDILITILRNRSVSSSVAEPTAWNSILPVACQRTARFVVALKHFYSGSFILDHCVFLSLSYRETLLNVGIRQSDGAS